MKLSPFLSPSLLSVPVLWFSSSAVLSEGCQRLHFKNITGGKSLVENNFETTSIQITFSDFVGAVDVQLIA